MKKIYLLIILLAPLIGIGQSNPPVAVNDTFYLEYNDTIPYVVLSTQTNTIVAGGPRFLDNDFDLDNSPLILDTMLYNGLGSLVMTMQLVNPPFIKRHDILYKCPTNYVGVDSLQYVLSDYTFPSQKDTAVIYFKIKNPEYAYLDLNNIHAEFDLTGLFRDRPNSIASFNVPKQNNPNDPKLTTLFAGNLWIVGKLQDSVHMNAETFGTTYGYLDWIEFKAPSGPIMDSMYYPEYSYKWDRLWKVNASDITYHQNNYMNAGYQPIEVIQNWPAHGDTSKGQAYYLAPFVDFNNDGVYNPMDGDYPKIKGQQAIYFIYNDIRHQANTDKPMGTEVHYMAYAYHCPFDSALFHTIFIDYTIYNRSANAYDSTFVGFWADYDIGGSSDDFVQCDVNRSTFFGYNGDDFDGGGNGVDGYLNHTPAQGVVFLKGAKQDDDGIDNAIGIGPNESINGYGFGDGIVDNEHWGMEHHVYYSIGGGQHIGDGDPQNNNDYYNYLRGKWRDGTSFVWGGTGHYSGGGTIPAKYLYPDSSDTFNYGTYGVQPPTSSWNETTINQPGDRRGMGSTGPFTLQPGDKIEFTLALVFGRDYQDSTNWGGILNMQERVDSIHSYFRNGFTTTACGQALSVNESELDENALFIYPNPFNNQLTVEYELENGSGEIRIISLYGQVIQNQVVNQTITSIDLSEIANGIYLVQLIDGNKLISKRVVKH